MDLKCVSISPDLKSKIVRIYVVIFFYLESLG